MQSGWKEISKASKTQKCIENHPKNVFFYLFHSAQIKNSHKSQKLSKTYKKLLYEFKIIDYFVQRI